jgi:hypothetical protein
VTVEGNVNNMTKNIYMMLPMHVAAEVSRDVLELKSSKGCGVEVIEI